MENISSLSGAFCFTVGKIIDIKIKLSRNLILSFLYKNSFIEEPDRDSNLFRATSVESDWEYPNMSVFTAWSHLMVQRQFIRGFWNFLNPSGSISFDRHIRLKYDTLNLMNIFMLMLTNFEKFDMKIFTQQPTFNFFELFLGLF